MHYPSAGDSAIIHAEFVWTDPLSLFAELKRRNVFRAAAAYVAVAWLVIQVAEATFPAFSLSEKALRNLILVLAAGFIPAVALSWAFEITPKGIKRDRDLEPGGELSVRTRRLLDRGIVAVLALGLAYFAVDKFVLEPARDVARLHDARQEGRTEALVESYGNQSIAVLPFTNMSADPEQEYFGDGMAEEVLNLLARIPELRVISRSSAFTFKGKDLKLNEIAAELNVAHILEGSVRRAGNRIRVTAQLIEARSDTHLWSQTWDRELADIFAIQDEIAAEVVANLRITLLGELPRARRVDHEAYLLFMQAREILDSSPDADLSRVDALLQRAIAIDPHYAEPWTTVAWAHYRCLVRRNKDSDPFCAAIPRDQLLAQHDDALEQALAIDPDNATAIAYRAWHIAERQQDFQAAAREFERAIALGPQVTDALRAAAIFSADIRRPHLAIRLIEYALQRDPLCRLCLAHSIKYYLAAGRYPEAEARAVAFSTAGRGGEFTLARVRLLMGRPEEALEAVASRAGHEPHFFAVKAMASYSLGQTQECHEALAVLENESWPESADWPILVAEVYAWIGDKERARAWLKQALSSAGDTGLGGYSGRATMSPFLSTIVAEPWWQDMLREHGRAYDQLEDIDFAFSLPGE
jgi:adenylate cyclase